MERRYLIGLLPGLHRSVPVEGAMDTITRSRDFRARAAAQLLRTPLACVSSKRAGSVWPCPHVLPLQLDTLLDDKRCNSSRPQLCPSLNLLTMTHSQSGLFGFMCMDNPETSFAWTVQMRRGSDWRGGPVSRHRSSLSPIKLPFSQPNLASRCFSRRDACDAYDARRSHPAALGLLFQSLSNVERTEVPTTAFGARR
jgi:hypothetical protein